MNSKEKEGLGILIAGGGMAGNTLALKLADNGFHPTLVGKTKPENSLIRGNTPFVRRATADILGISYDPRLLATNFELAGKSGIRTLALGHFLRQAFHLQDLNQNPWLALDLDLAERDLHQRILRNPNIRFVEGAITDIELKGQRVMGVTTKEDNGIKFLDADLVVDATGRASAITTIVRRKRSESIQEIRDPQPSVIIGGYIAFERNGLEETFPNPDNTMYVGVLRQALTGITLTPLANDPDGLATHMIGMGGETDAFKKTYEEARKNAREKADISEVRLAAMNMLTEGTIWRQLIENVKYVDRTVYAGYEDAVKLTVVGIKGLILLGDAMQHLNPVSTSGLSRIAQDTTRLMEILEQTQRGEFDQSIERFIKEQDVIARRRLKRASSLYRKERGIVGTYQKGRNRLSRILD